MNSFPPFERRASETLCSSHQYPARFRTCSVCQGSYTAAEMLFAPPPYQPNVCRECGHLEALLERADLWFVSLQESNCQGHPASLRWLDGVTTYCDGSCRTPRLRRLNGGGAS